MVYGYTPTGSWLFQKSPQYVVETSYGVPPASSTFALIGKTTDLQVTPVIGKTVEGALGSRDIVSQAKLAERYTVSIKYKCWDNMTFAKYGVNLANETTPTGTNAESLCIVWSRLINGSERYFALTGFKTDKISIEVSKDGGLVVGQDGVAAGYSYNVADLSSIGITTPTYVSTLPSTPVMTSLSGGSTPLLVDSVARETRRFKIDVNQNLAMLDLNGETLIQYLMASHRNISVDFDTPIRDNQFYDMLIAVGSCTISYTFYNSITPNIKVDITAAVPDGRTDNASESSNTFDFETVAFTPTTATLSG